MAAVVAWLLFGLAQVLRQDDPSELCEYYRHNHGASPFRAVVPVTVSLARRHAILSARLPSGASSSSLS